MRRLRFAVAALISVAGARSGYAASPAAPPAAACRAHAPEAAMRAGLAADVIAIAGLVAVAGVLAISALHRPASQESRYAIVEPAATTAAARPDPLMSELIRCRALPPQVDDPACRAAWDENRRRFFGETRATHVPGDPLPASAPIPAPSAVAER